MLRKYTPTPGQKKAGLLMAEALQGDRLAQAHIKSLILGEDSRFVSEAVSSSDLARSFIGTVNIQMEKLYSNVEKTWTDFCSREANNDFRPRALRELLLDQNTNMPSNGGEITLPFSLPNVPELSEYPSLGWATSAKAFSTHKRGARLPYSWEALVNDEWDLFSSIPAKLAEYAANTEDTQAYSILASTTGPNATTFSAANNNLNGAGNNSDATTLAGSIFDKEYPLTFDSLALAKRELQHRLYKNLPIAITRFRLIVPRAMGDYAKKLLNMTSGTAIDANNRTRVQFNVSNDDTSLTITDWLGRIDKSATSATTWYLVPDAGFDGTRTTMVNVFLKGHETPEFRQSANTGVYLGGGDVSPTEGSLLNDDIEFRVRHVVSATLLNPWGFLCSKGNEATRPAPAYGI